MRHWRIRTARILALTLCSCAPCISSCADDGDERAYLDEHFFGTFVDPSRTWRMWVSNAETVIVRMRSNAERTDTARVLANRALIGRILANKSPPDAEFLQSNGLTMTCHRVTTSVLLASPDAGVVITRSAGASREDMVDTQYLVSERWSAVYISHRAWEMVETGVLPFADSRESELARTLPLDELPFSTPYVAYRISGESAPADGWCPQ